MNFVEGHTFVSLPTGYGKSICYVPGLKGRCTVCVIELDRLRPNRYGSLTRPFPQRSDWVKGLARETRSGPPEASSDMPNVPICEIIGERAKRSHTHETNLRPWKYVTHHQEDILAR